MEWTESLQKAIKYIEEHLLDNISVDEISKEVNISSFYFQKAFKIMTGYSVAEYTRNRRLYLAALDAISGKEKVIELAYKYGYETPESFTKAFSRFHGISPLQIRNQTEKIKTFLPLKIVISIHGGNDMDYVVEKMESFQVIGFEREFSMDASYLEIPKFWDEFFDKYMKPLFAQEKPEDEVQQTICDCCIGEYGICIDDVGEEGKFRYLIVGTYKGGNVPEGMTVFTIPDMKWAKFQCTGPMPGALQSVNTKIFKEWLPNNPEYEIAMGLNIEWYATGDTSAPDYESAIWIPVREKLSIMEEKYMDIRIVDLPEIAIIGKEGFCTEESNIVQELWKQANENFGEVLELGMKEKNGEFVGFWGAMSDETMSFMPWTNNFTKGYYLAGIEVAKDAEAPEGWKKWIMPARKYLVTEVMFEHYMETFHDVLENQIPAKSMKLSGAACDYTEPSTGKNFIFFPIEEL